MAIPGKDREFSLEQVIFQKHFLKYPSNSVKSAAIHNRDYAYIWDSEFSRVH